MQNANSSPKNSGTAASKSRIPTSAKKKRYFARKDPIAQLRNLAGPYLRHGGKQNRRKQVKRLENAVRMTTNTYGNNDLRQIGKRHVHTWYQQLIKEGRSDKTLMNHYYAWCLLWTLLCRNGKPPKPPVLNVDT